MGRAGRAGARDGAERTAAGRGGGGALGARALVLSGGTVLYTLPTAGPLNDPAYVLPGAIRARAADLEAIAANVAPGMSVYLY